MSTTTTRSSLTISTDFNGEDTKASRKSWTLQSTPTGKSGRTWLQSPRKWSGKTPTNKDDGLTPTSSRLNTYLNADKRQTEEMFGKEEDLDNTDQSSEEKKNDVFSKLVHQVDRSGKPVNKATKRDSDDMSIENEYKRKDRESRSSVWGLFKGKFFGNEEGQGQESSTTVTKRVSTTPRSRGTNSSIDTSTVASGAKNGQSLKKSLKINTVNTNARDSEDNTPRTGRTTPRTSRNNEKLTPRSLSPRTSPYRSMTPGLLGECAKADRDKKCLILDLDETLVHSSFKPVDCADFVIPVAIEGNVTQVYVTKRPGVDEFMRRVGELYEVVIFTASLPQYANPLLDILDIHEVIKHRLFRSDCTYHNGSYVKDLSRIDRPIDQTIIVDNSPLSYMFQPKNAIGCSSFFDDPLDTELRVIGDFLVDIKDVSDIRDHCHFWENGCKNPNAPIGNSPRGRIVTGA